MGAGNNAGMRAARGRYGFLLNSDAWVEGDGLERLVAFADAHPYAAVVGPRLLNPDGSLQRSVRGDPTLWRLATEYLFLRKLGAAHRPAERLLRRRLRPRRRARGRVAARGPRCSCGARRPTRSGCFDESFFMFSEETDWLLRFRNAGWQVLFFPGAEVTHVGGALARRSALRREPARHPPFPAQASRRPGGRARPAAAARGRCGCGSLLVRGDRGSGTGRASASSPRATSRRSLAMIGEYLRLAFGDGARAAARPSRRAGVRTAERLGNARLVARGALRRLGGRVQRPRHDLARGRDPRADRRRGPGRGPPTAPARGVGRGGARQVSAPAPASCCRGRPRPRCSGTSQGVVAGDGLFHEARVRKLVELGSLHLRTVDEFRDGGLHPGYAFPLWHGFLAVVAKLSGLDPAWC